MNAATKSESGVRMITARASRQSMKNIKIIVPAMVTIPEKSWRKICERPSPTASTSLITRLMRSPCGWVST